MFAYLCPLQRLDPAVMHISCILAGTLLARLGRPEVSNCIAGLKQYSYAYEEAGDQAKEMDRLYNRCRMGELELSHMISTVAQIPSTSQSHRMSVDEDNSPRLSGSSHVSPTNVTCH